MKPQNSDFNSYIYIYIIDQISIIILHPSRNELQQKC